MSSYLNQLILTAIRETAYDLIKQETTTRKDTLLDGIFKNLMPIDFQTDSKTISYLSNLARCWRIMFALI